VIRWGIIGCGDVTEVKSGPGFQKANGSALVAVMRRDRAKAEDYARRHGVPRFYGNADELIADADVDAVYVATPVSSHCDLAHRVAAAGKPCLVEKPMAMTHAECLRMVEAFNARRLPLWVAYYRRALPRFLKVRELLDTGAIGTPTAIHVAVTDRLASAETMRNWRFDPAISGGGLFHDLGSHCIDLFDFLLGRIDEAFGFSSNTGGAYAAPDLTKLACRFVGGAAGTGIWDFNAATKADLMTITGSAGSIATPVFSDTDVVVKRNGRNEVLPIRNPPHVHQPLIQSIVDELGGGPRCASTGESGARAAWVMDRCR
jgi:1,5-anhydro-D-fructose reductase (1,5-anhydro-D-mannitol-forming)